MISIEEVKKWLIANCIDERGNLNISGLDFSDFNGDIDISGMRVKGDLYQGYQNVKGKMFLQDTSELQKAFDYDGAIYYEKVEKIPEMTLEEIEPKLDTEYFNIAKERIIEAKKEEV